MNYKNINKKKAAIISVVLTSYNSEKFIKEALDSVQSQTFKKWELFLVDDNSDDNTRRIAEIYAKHDPRISLIPSDKRSGGPAVGRNRGVAASSSEWVAFLDADDLWHPQKLEMQFKIILANSCRFCCSKMRDFEQSSDLSFDPVSKISYSIVKFKNQRIRAQIPISSVILSRKVALDFPFNEKSQYVAVEDYDCWLRILRNKTHCYKLNHVLIGYRRSQGQISKCKATMLRKVFVTHRSVQKTSLISAFLYTFLHAVGGLYYRWYKKEL